MAEVRQQVLSRSDFLKILDEYGGRNVTHTPRTATKNNRTGQIEYTEGTAVSIYCYFTKLSQTWTFEGAGKFEGGDALLNAKYTDSVDKDDLIDVDGETYIVKDKLNVVGTYYTDGTVQFAYTTCNLFKYE